jgi:DNA invertase Pin-like site-specific DNA recombinase
VKQRTNWKYVGLYSDEGISGTSIKKRTGFQKMLDDCKDGKIDLIVVKDVSRFARNMVDCLSATRELLRLKPPVGVYFDSVGINTLDIGSEVFLSIFAMFAQMDSELKSANIKIGQAANNKDKKYLCPTNNLIGYDKIKKYSMVIEPKGAKAVQLIYKLFLSGIPLAEIAKKLMSIKVPTGGNMFKWTSSTVSNIIKNEKYCGDIVTQKQYIEDIFTHRAIKNIGQRRQIYDQEHHDAIISRDEHIRALLLLKSNYYSPHFNLHYEIKVIRKGILTGFIPLCIAFGGYYAEHYLGAILKAEIPEMPFNEEFVRISKSISAEMFSSNESECMTISRNSITLNTRCVKYMNCDYIEILLHPQERLLAIRKSSKKNPNAVPLTAKTMAAEISRIIYDLMGWRRNFSHRITADIFEKEGRSVLFFNLSNSEYCAKSKRLLTEEWLHVFDKPPGKQKLLTRLILAEKLKNWEVGAKASDVQEFNTGVPETEEKEQQILITELEKEYVGWQPPTKRTNNDN